MTKRVEGIGEAARYFGGAALDIDEALCLNLRGRLLHCERCHEACPAEALALGTDAVDLDEDRCTGCGACVPCCPSGVFRLSGFAPRRFLGAVVGQESVHLHCTASTHRCGGVVIPCHRILDARLLAAAAAEGITAFHLHGLDHCADCDKGDARACLPELEAPLAQWLGDRAPRLLPGTDHGPAGARRREDQPHVSRRDFLRLAGAQGVQEVATWVVPVGEREEAAETLAFFQGDLEHRRPVIQYTLLTERAGDLPWRDGAELPWRTRTVGERCTACLACGERCPTGALQAREEAAGRALDYDPALCTDCGLCERVCPEGAVEAAPLPQVAALDAGRRVIMHRSQRACGRCGHPFAPAGGGDELCPVCRNEQDLDDEWLEMLGG